MNAKFTSILILSAVAASSSGCVASRSMDLSNSAEVRTSDFESLWDRCARTLRKHHFRLDRQDRRAGVITTHPEVSKQFFEFWRSDAPGLRQAIESNLHTVRRTVEVSIERKDGDLYTIAVQVQKNRYSAPERQVTTASGALQIFGEKLPTTTGKMLPEEAGVHWASLGRDVILEGMIVDRISRYFQPG
jgi:hypothetical protein